MCMERVASQSDYLALRGMTGTDISVQISVCVERVASQSDYLAFRGTTGTDINVRGEGQLKGNNWYGYQCAWRVDS